MAYDEKLAARVREAIAGHGVEERRMFGGLAFLQRGKMCCGVVKDELMVRVGPDGYEAALEEPHVRPMDFTGRPMKGLVYVAGAGLRTRAMLTRWIERGVTAARTQPTRRKSR